MTQTEPIVFVVDDDPSVLRGVDRLVRSAGYRAETFCSAREFLRRGAHDGPACLVLDVKLPELGGLELQQTLAKTARFLPVIFISGYGDIPMSVRAMKNGAQDFLPKPFAAEDLLRAIAAGLARSRLEQQNHLETAATRERLGSLTQREHEVLRGVIAGKLNKKIAAELGVGEKTVKVHRGRMMHKMGVHSVADLVRAAESGGETPRA